jgi:hypothetical protein
MTLNEGAAVCRDSPLSTRSRRSGEPRRLKKLAGKRKKSERSVLSL